METGWEWQHISDTSAALLAATPGGTGLYLIITRVGHGVEGSDRQGELVQDEEVGVILGSKDITTLKCFLSIIFSIDFPKYYNNS